MQSFPHRYASTVVARERGDVAVASGRAPLLRSAAPLEFGGPGDRWSPETLLVAAVGDCFVLTFRAIAHASKLSFIALSCEVVGTLDRVDGVTRFTGFDINARLTLPSDGDVDKAQRLLERAEHACLVTNSLSSDVKLTAAVECAAVVAV